ncbi:MBL fold metallo-hydrolase [Algoriphagus formosus]|uniref:MBL fold metallo-hydrolase n=1 Tax=Algoriphagus formosus TaxID=2007308 RepID=UPI003F711FB3
MPFHQFGGKVTPDLVDHYSKSENWKNGRFQNLQATSMNIDLKDFPKVLVQQFKGRSSRQPNRQIPMESFDQGKFLEGSSSAKFSWYGHSAILLRMSGMTIFIDPMMGPDASPIAPFQTKRFSDGTLDMIDDLPEIDLLMMTHDHYDHLDLESIRKLKAKTKRYAVALGVKRHLVKWGVDADLIDEFDWWQDRMIGPIQVTFTPTRHFSGRGLTDRAQTLWGGWVFQSSEESIWFSGDGGFGDHFEEIGRRFGGFDFAFMECGQYNEHWRQLHLFPDESVIASQKGLAKKIMPVHWAGFTLAPHHWKEPVEHFVQKARELEVDFIIPQIGQVRSILDTDWEEWWLEY